MIITCLQENLLAALQQVQRVVPSKPSLPILSSLALTTDEHSCTLAATDLYLGMRVTVQAQVTDPISLVIPGKIMTELVSTLPPGKITLTTDESNQKIVLASGASKTTFQVQSSDEYPAFPEVVGQQIELTADDVGRVLQEVAFAASVDSTRPVLTSLLWIADSTHLEVVATDGFRLATLSLPHAQESLPSLQLLFPAKALSEVGRLIKQAKSASVSVIIAPEQQQALFQIGSSQLFVRLIEGEYPPYEKIIPADFGLQLSCDTQELLQHLKSALVFAKESSNIIQFSIHDEEMEITAQSTTFGSHQGVLPIQKISGSSHTIAFNARYVLDFLSTVSTQRVWFGMNESLKPALFRPEGAEEYRYVVMPFRVTT